MEKFKELFEDTDIDVKDLSDKDLQAKKVSLFSKALKQLSGSPRQKKIKAELKPITDELKARGLMK